ncbi:hypothetical protein FRC17_008241 [Serendipita sp. 399]|nr:hypothetical protein FRC17_008241 [Serendipita sp. 399]
MPTAFLRDGGQENIPQERDVNNNDAIRVVHRDVEPDVAGTSSSRKHTPAKRRVIERIKSQRPPIKPFEFREAWLIDPNRPVPPVSDEALVPNELLKTMAETQSPNLIWEAYRSAVDQEIYIPPSVLERVSRVLIRKYAATRETFLRLHDVIIQYQKQGNVIRRWQWNALIYHSALGLRKLTTSQYQSALDIYWQMLSFRKLPKHEEESTPDIYTYSTLLYIAICTRNHEHVAHAMSLLEASKLQPDRIAQLTMIPFYLLTDNLRGVRRIVKQINASGTDIGIDGINAYIWAFGKQGHLQLLGDVYTALRANVKGGANEEQQGPHVALKSRLERDMVYDMDTSVTVRSSQFVPFKPAQTMYHGSLSVIEKDEGPVRVVKDLIIREHHVPDNITYTICMQAFAYHGDLYHALKVFGDMTTTSDLSRPWSEKVEAPFPATMEAYRALFVGIVRKSRAINRFAEYSLPNVRHIENSAVPADAEWLEEALHFVFESFLEIDSDYRPSDMTVRWIMEAFANITQFDAETLNWVWSSLVTRFGKLRVPPVYRNILMQDHTYS